MADSAQLVALLNTGVPVFPGKLGVRCIACETYKPSDKPSRKPFCANHEHDFHRLSSNLQLAIRSLCSEPLSPSDAAQVVLISNLVKKELQKLREAKVTTSLNNAAGGTEQVVEAADALTQAAATALLGKCHSFLCSSALQPRKANKTLKGVLCIRRHTQQVGYGCQLACCGAWCVLRLLFWLRLPARGNGPSAFPAHIK